MTKASLFKYCERISYSCSLLVISVVRVVDVEVVMRAGDKEQFEFVNAVV